MSQRLTIVTGDRGPQHSDIDKVTFGGRDDVGIDLPLYLSIRDAYDRAGKLEYIQEQDVAAQRSEK